MEEQNIINTITSIFNGSDRHEWDLVRNSFYYDVFLDYFSLSNKPGEKVKPDDIIKGWSDFLPKFKLTHHVITNFEVSVTETNASVFCKGSALHYLPGSEGGDTWTLIGTYDFRLVKVAQQWRVSSLIFKVLFEDGNKDLPAFANLQSKSNAEV